MNPKPPSSPPFQIKICGITRPSDAIFAIEAGADAIGLNFYDASPRAVAILQAIEIVDAIKTWSEKKGTFRPFLVGVFVNAPRDQVIETVATLDLDAIQFHGDETFAAMRAVKDRIAAQVPKSPQSRKLIFIRALRSLAKENSNGSVSLDVGQIVLEARPWIENGVDTILLDAAVEGGFGGSGKTLDWKSVRKLDLAVPIVLAGGLTPGNVARAIQITGIQSVDVASGVESEIGQKDEHLLHLFVKSTGLRGHS